MRTNPASRLIMLLLGFVLSLVTSPAQALSFADLCFYAPFDGSLDAAFAGGNAKPAKVAGQYTFVPGMSGGAVVAGELGKQLSYDVTGNFPGSKGTISIWIKTLDWGYGDFKDHLIVSIPEKLQFYHANHSGGIHLEWLESWGGSTYNYPQGPVKGEWKHLVYTWGDGGVTLYQNGQFVSRFELTNNIYFPSAPKELPQWPDGLLFDICDPSRTKDSGNTTVIDELMLFNRPLSPVEVKSLYRSVAVPISETVARIGFTDRKPNIDGIVKQAEWQGTAEFCDFVDVPFGNLSTRPVRSNISYDKKALYISVRSHELSKSGDCVEIWLTPELASEPRHFVIFADGKREQSGGKIWQAASGKSGNLRSFEAAIPWASIGIKNPKAGDSIRLNIVRRWSDKYGDAASWTGSKVTLGGNKPVFAMSGLGRLNYAQLDLTGKITTKSGIGDLQAEVRLQPSDLKEYWDPKTLPGVKSYTGARILLDKTVKQKVVADLRAATTFSDTDINSLWLKVTDSTGDVIYQTQKPFVPQPPIIISLKTYPNNDRLEITADVSNYLESPLKDISADIQLIAPSGDVVKTTRIDRFSASKEIIDLTLNPLPDGNIKVRAVLQKGKEKISEFTSSFEKLALAPWVGNKLGKDDIVLPPFTPIKVEGQSVSVWGRTYTWDNSLFPVQVISDGEELLGGPIELLTSEATNKPNPARVTITEQTDTKAVIEAVGEISGVPVTARHLIEYDGMCLTTLAFSPQKAVRLDGLALRIPYKRAYSTLYSMSPIPEAGAVRETVNLVCQPMNGERDIEFRNTVWLGNEDRGMTWFTEDAKGWKLAGNLKPVNITAEEDSTLFTVRFAANAFDLDNPLSLMFGIIATPVKPMQDNWRFLRNGRDWGYRWYGVFTAANNDIAHPFPSFKDYLADQHKAIPLFVPYQMPIWINTRQPESKYYGEEWFFPPRVLIGNDNGDEERHYGVCLGSGWQDFMVYYAVKAYEDLDMDGYYLDGMIPDCRGCTNAHHGHGWVDDNGVLHGTYTLLDNREFLKRLAVEFYKRGRPYLLFVHLSGCVEMPTFSFADMGWNGEQFSTAAMPARDYNKILTLPYYRAQFLGQQFGIPQQFLLEFWPKPAEVPIGKTEIDTALGLALVHGVGDNMMAGNFAVVENADYARGVLNMQDSFGIREKDFSFLPYWDNRDAVSVEPANENLVCSIWQGPGKALLVLNNSTQENQKINVKLNLPTLGLEGNLRAKDLISGEVEILEAGVVKTSVGRSCWRLIVVEKAD